MNDKMLDLDNCIEIQIGSEILGETSTMVICLDDVELPDSCLDGVLDDPDPESEVYISEPREEPTEQELKDYVKDPNNKANVDQWLQNKLLCRDQRRWINEALAEKAAEDQQKAFDDAMTVI